MEKIKNDIKNKSFSSLYMIFGEEKFIINKLVEEIVQSLSLQDDNMNYQVLDGKNTTVDTILDYAMTIPFMAEKKLIVVRDSDLFTKARKDEGEKMSELSAIPDSSIVVFVEQNVEKVLKSYKAISKIGVVEEIGKQNEQTLFKFVKSMLNDTEVSASNDNISYFLSCVSTDMNEISQELTKLIEYIEVGEITKEAIDKLTTKTTEYKVFLLVNLICEKKSGEALKQYDLLLENKESPLMLLTLIAKQFKLLLLTKILIGEKKDNNAIADQLKVKSFFVRTYVTQSKNFTAKELYNNFKECLDVDVKIKSGVEPEEIAVWKLIVKTSQKAK